MNFDEFVLLFSCLDTSTQTYVELLLKSAQQQLEYPETHFDTFRINQQTF